jgi:hypothetical protein
VASRTIFDVSLYLRLEITMAGVETRGMKRNVAPQRGYMSELSVTSTPAAGTRASSA